MSYHRDMQQGGPWNQTTQMATNGCDSLMPSGVSRLNLVYSSSMCITVGKEMHDVPMPLCKVLSPPLWPLHPSPPCGFCIHHRRETCDRVTLTLKRLVSKTCLIFLGFFCSTCIYVNTLYTLPPLPFSSIYLCVVALPVHPQSNTIILRGLGSPLRHQALCLLPSLCKIKLLSNIGWLWSFKWVMAPLMTDRTVVPLTEVSAT